MDFEPLFCCNRLAVARLLCARFLRGRLQFKSLALRDILLISCYRKQREEQRLLCVCFLEILHPLCRADVREHDCITDEPVICLLDFLAQAKLLSSGEVL